MKVEKWYDVCCDGCHRHLSTDFGCGMLTSREETIMYARRNGFRDIKGKTYCPSCASEIKKKEITP